MNKKSKKINWWIDAPCFPLVLLAFLLGYMWRSFEAGWAYAEYYFDKDAFHRRYGHTPKDMP